MEKMAPQLDDYPIPIAKVDSAEDLEEKLYRQSTVGGSFLYDSNQDLDYADSFASSYSLSMKDTPQSQDNRSILDDEAPILDPIDIKKNKPKRAQAKDLSVKKKASSVSSNSNDKASQQSDKVSSDTDLRKYQSTGKKRSRKGDSSSRRDRFKEKK